MTDEYIVLDINDEQPSDDIIIELQEKGVTFEGLDTLMLLQENAVRMHINQFQVFPSINLSTIEKPQISLFLCKPDFTIIAKLKDAYDINLNIKALQVNELSFKIPLKIDQGNTWPEELDLQNRIDKLSLDDSFEAQSKRVELKKELQEKLKQRNTLITNPNISLIRYRYLIKIVLTNPGNNNSYIEYYQVSTPKAIAAEDSDYKEYTCLSLINELADRQITGYNVNSFTLEQIFNGGYDEVRKRNINGLLHDTNWSLGSPGGISNKLTFRRRSINISSDTTLLNIILSTLVETYNILPIFDTENRKIYIYSPEEIGKTIDQNILRVSYQKYLQNLDLTENDSEFTTRLRARGKDDLTLHTVTPTGQPYLENFDYFKTGYADEQYNYNIENFGNINKTFIVNSHEFYNILIKVEDIDNAIVEVAGSNITDNIINNQWYNYIIETELNPAIPIFDRNVTINIDVNSTQNIKIYFIHSHSLYWSDELCASQIDYENKLLSYTGIFNNLLTDQLTLQSNAADLQIDAANASTKLFFTQDILDVLQGLDKGFYRFRNIISKDEIIFPLDTSDPIRINDDIFTNDYLNITTRETATIGDIHYLVDLNPDWYYYIMCKIESLENLTILLNNEVINNLSINTWYHNNLLKIHGNTSLEIILQGHTDQNIMFDIVRITKDEYINEGAREKQIIFLGDPPIDIVNETWRIGKSDPINNTETIWTQPLTYNISKDNLQTALAAIYNTSDIIVNKGGSMAEGNVYFEIEFPYSLAMDSYLVGDFTLITSIEMIPFIIKTQNRMILLEKYNEDVQQTFYNNAMIELNAEREKINNIAAQINAIGVELSLNNNFSLAEIIERNNYIVEKVYNNPNIINPTDLLQAAIEYFNEINEPNLLLNLQTVNFMEVAECHQDFDKLFYNPLMTGLYDTIVVRHELHNINVECMILEINYNFASSEISFTVSNVRQILDDQTKFLKSLNTSTNAAATILSEKYKWDGAADTATELDRILNETWDAAARAINSGVDNSVEIGRRGIRITDPTDPLHVIAIVAGWLGISADGGNNYRTVLNADGIAAKYLIGQIIMGAQLHIINQGGNIEIGESGILVYDQEGVKRVHIGDFGDFSDPDYIAGTDYGFYFKGKTDPATGQEHYLEWNGSKLKIGGDLDAVTGTFQNLIAGTPQNYMQLSAKELHETGYDPFMDFYANTIKRLSIEKDIMKFYDENSGFTGYIKASIDGNRTILNLGSNDIGSFASYISGQSLARLTTEIYPQPYVTLQSYDNANNIDSSIDVTDTIDINGQDGVGIGSLNGINIETTIDDIILKTISTIITQEEDDDIILKSDIRIESCQNIHLGSSVDFDSLYVAYGLSIDDTYNIGMGTTNGMIALASNLTLISSPFINLDGGVVTLTGIDGTAPDKRYKFVKNGELPNPDGVINFICPQ